MNKDQSSLARKQLERRLAPLREAKITAPPRGWIKAIREALGMTARQLAARMDASPSRIPVIEKAEVTGATTIKTLREAAEAMNCTFVYAFVPTKPLDDILRERAIQKRAKTLLDSITPCDWKIKLCSNLISTMNSGAWSNLSYQAH